jgi:hypothetical protein
MQVEANGSAIADANAVKNTSKKVKDKSADAKFKAKVK